MACYHNRLFLGLDSPHGVRRIARMTSSDGELVPLFIPEPPGGPDASHQIASPGGYEFWLLRAADESGQAKLSIGFFDGHPSLHPYLSRYRKFWQRPTRNAPPLPRDFPVIEINFALGPKRNLSDVHLLAPGSLIASIHELNVIAGDQRFFRREDRAIEVHVRHKRVLADLLFMPDPQCPAQPVVVDGNGQYHRASDPRCQVTGQIHFIGDSSEKQDAVEFRGMGSCEHRWLIRK